jgi:hypothetical protein
MEVRIGLSQALASCQSHTYVKKEEMKQIRSAQSLSLWTPTNYRGRVEAEERGFCFTHLVTTTSREECRALAPYSYRLDNFILCTKQHIQFWETIDARNTNLLYVKTYSTVSGKGTKWLTQETQTYIYLPMLQLDNRTCWSFENGHTTLLQLIQSKNKTIRPDLIALSVQCQTIKQLHLFVSAFSGWFAWLESVAAAAGPSFTPDGPASLLWQVDVASEMQNSAPKLTWKGYHITCQIT